MEAPRATPSVESEARVTLGLLATVLLLRGSFNKAEHGVVPGERPAEATPGGRRGLEVVTTPLGGGHRRM